MNRIQVTEQLPYEIKERRGSFQLVSMDPNVEMHTGRVYHHDSQATTVHVTLPPGTIISPVEHHNQANYSRRGSFQLQQAPIIVQQVQPIAHTSAVPIQPVYLQQPNQQMVYYEDPEPVMHMTPVVVNNGKVVKKAPSIVYKMVPM